MIKDRTACRLLQADVSPVVAGIRCFFVRKIATRGKQEAVMLKVNDIVLYGAAGACTVREFCKKQVGGT